MDHILKCYFSKKIYDKFWIFLHLAWFWTGIVTENEFLGNPKGTGVGGFLKG